MITIKNEDLSILDNQLKTNQWGIVYRKCCNLIDSYLMSNIWWELPMNITNYLDIQRLTSSAIHDNN